MFLYDNTLKKALLNTNHFCTNTCTYTCSMNLNVLYIVLSLDKFLHRNQLWVTINWYVTWSTFAVFQRNFRNRFPYLRTNKCMSMIGALTNNTSNCSFALLLIFLQELMVLIKPCFANMPNKVTKITDTCLCWLNVT